MFLEYMEIIFSLFTHQFSVMGYDISIWNVMVYAIMAGLIVTFIRNVFS